MIETDLQLQPIVVDGLDRDSLLHFAGEAEYQDRAAARRKLRYALQWCRLNPVREDGFAAGLGDGLTGRDGRDCEDHLAGEGTPLVAAGAPAELGAAWQITTNSAAVMMGNALELAHRLPLTWARLEALEIQPWKARRLATWTRPLPPEGAAWVDQQLADRLHNIGLPTIDKAVTAAIAIWRPDLVKEQEAVGKDAWHVTVDLGLSAGGVWDGTSTLDALGDTADFTAFANLVTAVAEALRVAGDNDTLNQRRAKALGVIGRGEHAALLAQPAAAPENEEPARPAAKPPTGRMPVPRRGTQPHTLYVHVTAADLADYVNSEPDQPPLGRVERLGPATLDLLRTWVGQEKFRVQPVLDPTRPDRVDVHDPPAWMRETVILRDKHCVFPWCETDARSCDQDHIVPYDPDGPPGQTSVDALACLCRSHHRAKTFFRWRYRRTPDGAYHWTSPAGRTYLVHPDEGTNRLP